MFLQERLRNRAGGEKGKYLGLEVPFERGGDFFVSEVGMHVVR